MNLRRSLPLSVQQQAPRRRDSNISLLQFRKSAIQPTIFFKDHYVVIADEEDRQGDLKHKPYP
jgi:hypothetical protein